MSHDFELRRLQDKIKELREEQGKTSHLIVKVRRDEQRDIDRIQRDYDIRIRTMETRQKDAAKEIARKERDLENLRYKIREEEETERMKEDALRDPSGRHRLR